MNDAAGLWASWDVFLRGAGLLLSLIVAIGAQNVFVISQGLAKSHVFTVCAICAICDAVFMGAGIFLVGEVFAKNEFLTLLLGVSGVVFLVCYAVSSLLSSYRGSHFAKIRSSRGAALAPVILKTLAVTLLNPHVYLDTVVVVGSLGTTIAAPEKIWFYAGGVAVSCTWFFSLGYGASALSRLFASKRAWQIIDFCVGILMLYMAYLIAEFIFKI